MRILLLSPWITASQRSGLLRAAWAMLYAHYEGFCKNSLMIFYDFVEGAGLSCGSLPDKTREFALRDSIKHIRGLPGDEIIPELLQFESNYLGAAPEFPEVDTGSNLWPDLLKELLDSADLSSEKVVDHKSKLNTLVARRNAIAHGEDNFINDIEYYFTFESAVYDVMYDIAIQVDMRLKASPYI